MLDDCLQSLYELKRFYYYASVVRVLKSTSRNNACLRQTGMYRKVSNIYLDCIKHKTLLL